MYTYTHMYVYIYIYIIPCDFEMGCFMYPMGLMSKIRVASIG